MSIDTEIRKARWLKALAVFSAVLQVLCDVLSTAALVAGVLWLWYKGF